jgi:CheY-like chemotaxis protein
LNKVDAMPARILIVDDNPTNLKLACDLLEIEGYQVQKAKDGEEALAMIGRASFDLVLMDIELPGMDGLTLTRLLKENPATHDLPVVALTAYAMKGDDQKAFDAGCSGYLTKPIDTRKFPQQIAEYLGKPLGSERNGL